MFTFAGQINNPGSRAGSWVGRWSLADRDQLVFHFRNGEEWWLGTFDGHRLHWAPAGNTAGFGDVSRNPFWVGNFAGPGRAGLLFYSPYDDNWWLGTADDGGRLGWALAGNTAGFGHAINDGRPFWAANFSRADRTDMLFYYPGDHNWWLGTFDGHRFNWALAGNTAGSPLPTNTGLVWTGDFNGDGRAEVLWFDARDGNWWMTSFPGARAQLAVVANTPQPQSQPPPQTKVPNLVHQLLRDAIKLLDAAHLREGVVINPTGELHTDKLLVTNQDPAAGTTVPQGTPVNLRVELATKPPPGVKALNLYNCNTDRRPVRVWLYDTAGGGWQEKGKIDPQYDASGGCPAAGSKPLELKLEAGHLYFVVAVDEGNINCGVNDPTNVNCQRLFFTAAGDPKGPTAQLSVS
jgi:PASTA domain